MEFHGHGIPRSWNSMVRNNKLCDKTSFQGISSRLGHPFCHLEQLEEISHAKSSIWFEMRNAVNKFLFRGFPVDWATLFAIWSSLKKFQPQNFHNGLK